MFQFRRIMAAMDSTGLGTSPESPIFALGPTDGQNYVTKYMRGKIKSMGSGFDKDKNFLDIINATMDDGSERTFYFIIQHAQLRQMKQFEKASK